MAKQIKRPDTPLAPTPNPLFATPEEIKNTTSSLSSNGKIGKKFSYNNGEPTPVITITKTEKTFKRKK